MDILPFVVHTWITCQDHHKFLFYFIFGIQAGTNFFFQIHLASHGPLRVPPWILMFGF